MKHTYVKNNFTVIQVENIKEGSIAAFNLLKDLVDRKTLLFLSGGSSPKLLYKMIALDRKKQIAPGAVATVDERWGPPDHQNSNEKMIRATNLYKYFSNIDSETHIILHGILNRSETALRYETVLEGLFERLKKIIAIMGIGSDGHTAGIAPGLNIWNNRLIKDYNHKKTDWNFPERITLTPYALKKINTSIILAFGKKKSEVLSNIFTNNTKKAKYPAEVFNNDKKNYLITDQKIINY